MILQMQFDVLWRYFAWCNQTLAVFTLWTITVYLHRTKKIYLISLIPAIFMTMVCSTYLFVAPRPEGVGLSYNISLGVGAVITIIITACFFLRRKILTKEISRKHTSSS
jgi:carbon starvation protein CstA